MKYPKELENDTIKIKQFLLLLKSKDVEALKKYLQRLRKNIYAKEYFKQNYNNPEWRAKRLQYFNDYRKNNEEKRLKYNKNSNENKRNQRIELLL